MIERVQDPELLELFRAHIARPPDAPDEWGLIELEKDVLQLIDLGLAVVEKVDGEFIFNLTERGLQAGSE